MISASLVAFLSFSFPTYNLGLAGLVKRWYICNQDRLGETAVTMPKKLRDSPHACCWSHTHSSLSTQPLRSGNKADRPFMLIGAPPRTQDLYSFRDATTRKRETNRSRLCFLFPQLDSDTSFFCSLQKSQGPPSSKGVEKYSMFRQGGNWPWANTRNVL